MKKTTGLPAYRLVDVWHGGYKQGLQVEPLFTYKISRDEACNRWVESQMKQMKPDERK
jgi:hypothetical protein